MATVTVNRKTRQGAQRTLATIARNPSAPRDVQANCTYWAGAVHGRMDRRAAQTAAWVLLDASGITTLPLDVRRTARYWGAYLEAMV